jgi:chemotaxis protein histidine kinase CheA
MLFDEKKKQRTILQINPLHEVEVSFTRPEGGYESRYLNFAFRRIMDEGKVSRVFVAINDVTERVELAEQLRMSEAKKDRQFEFLLTVINQEPRLVKEFIDTAKAHIEDISVAMRTQDFGDGNTGQSAVMRQRLERIFRAVHSIKGNAQMIKLNYFVTMCQSFEGKIVNLKNRSALGGEDFMAIVVQQVDLQKDIDELAEISERFVVSRPPGSLDNAALTAALQSSGRGGSSHPKKEPPKLPPDAVSDEPAPAEVAEVVEAPSAPPAPAVVPPPVPVAAVAPRSAADDLIAQLTSLAESTAEAHDKMVRLEAADLDMSVLTPEQSRGLKDILIQLVRNSVVHGIEAPAKRAERNKPEIGTIAIVGNARRADAATAFTFAYRDDGGGLNVEAIRAKAVENGLLSAEAAAALAPGAVVGMIFQSGFSTAPELTADAGRGVGMDIIKDLIVDRFGGRIGLKFEPGRYTEFTFSFPLAPRLAETNGAVLVGAR